jgi:hypothetical protein
MEGRAKLNGMVFEQGDAAKVSGEDLHVAALSDVHLLLVEMAKE